MNLQLAYLFPSQEGKFMQEEILASRCLLVWVPIYNFPFPKEKRLYEFELNPDSIQLILQPPLRVGMVCFNIFDSGVLTNLCLVCFRKS
jgi:hypothetical protein